MHGSRFGDVPTKEADVERIAAIVAFEFAALELEVEVEQTEEWAQPLVAQVRDGESIEVAGNRVVVFAGELEGYFDSFREYRRRLGIVSGVSERRRLEFLSLRRVGEHVGDDGGR